MIVLAIGSGAKYHVGRRSEDLPTMIEIGKDGTVISLNVKEAEALLKWLPFLREQGEEAEIELTIPPLE